MIKHALCVLVLFAAASIATAQPTPTPTQSPSPAPAKTPTPTQAPAAPHTNLKVGQAAPDFTLPSSISGPDGRKVRYKLSDFKGKKNVVLAFYVFAFTGG